MPADESRRELVPARQVLKRWLAIVTASAIGSAIVLVSLCLLRARFGGLFQVPPWLFGVSAFALVLSSIPLGRGRWLAFVGLRHFRYYPPLWIAGLLGTGATLLVLSCASSVLRSIELSDELGPPLFRLGAGCTSAFVLLLLFALAAKRRPEPAAEVPESDAKSDVKSLAAIGTSFDDLTAWLEDDQPITRATNDRFGRTRIARRIARRLASPRPPAQAVVGGLGSGKTTVRELVSEALAGDAAGKRVHLVPVELWPYETSRAAVEGVIRSLISALSKEVNVVALRGLPGAYVEAMSAAGGIWAAIVRAQGLPSNPIETLTAVDEIATAIGHRYVVWIEDLERFASAGDEDERLNPIRALLYGLDRLTSVTVVTATTTLHTRFDLEKISRFVEGLPEIAEAEAATILALFRDGCRRMDDVIDPVSREARQSLDKLGDRERIRTRLAWFGRRIHDINDAIPVLCTTPRTLKHALRACFETWCKLAGEIDFDQVLVASLLRTSSPEVFALIQEHIHTLRMGALSDTEDRKRARQAWADAVQRAEMNPRTRAAVDQAISFIFGSDPTTRSPQGLACSNHVDYWERFLSVPTLVDAEKDQPVLRILVGDDDEALLDLVETNARSDAVEDFKWMLKTNRLQGLLVKLTDRRAKESAESWPEAEPPGLLPVWRMWLRRSERGDLSSETSLIEVKAALSIAVPRNLALAVELEQHFITVSGQVHNPLERKPEYIEDAKKHLRDLFVESYKGKPGELARALRGSKPASLRWICWGFDNARLGKTQGIPFERWLEVAATVLEAARHHPRVLLPQLACLITRSRTVLDDELHHEHDFDEAQAGLLFGSAATALEPFANERREDWSGAPYVQAVIDAATKS